MEKIKKLKRLIKEFNLDGYLIPKNDEFFGEYIPKNKDRLNYISNFSGSYGFALILKRKNYLFVDGRYSLQAKIQSEKNFEIITIPKRYPSNVLKNQKLSIGYDPKLHTNQMLKHLFQKTKCKLIPINKNLIDKIWIKKKKEKPKKFFTLRNEITDQCYKNKLKQLCKILRTNKIDLQFISAPENVAWLLNLRGDDSAYTPIPNSYLIIDSLNKANLFCDLKKIDSKTKKNLQDIKIIDINYLEIFLKRIKNKNLQIDNNSCSILFRNIIKKNNIIIETKDPIYNLKSIKNKIEIKNSIESHIYDGAALTKFLFWLKNNYKRKKISEIGAQEKLLKYRKKNKSFRMLSFPTISGSGPNGAIIHYKANNKTNRILRRGDIYLVDSGGQYNFGTTDVTRTISLENKDKRIKDIFTRVLKGHIAVATFKLKSNTSGSEIDLVARKYLKEINLDYAHGTGHGVGYFLNVHEGPQGISRGNKVNFKTGMIVSNEPGYYEQGKFGIRIENLVTVKKNSSYLKFENLTMAPIDKNLIKKTLLNKKEISWLNNYHSTVFKNLKRFMNGSELVDLRNSCSNL